MGDIAQYTEGGESLAGIDVCLFNSCRPLLYA